MVYRLNSKIIIYQILIPSSLSNRISSASVKKRFPCDQSISRRYLYVSSIYLLRTTSFTRIIPSESFRRLELFNENFYLFDEQKRRLLENQYLFGEHIEPSGKLQNKVLLEEMNRYFRKLSRWLLLQFVRNKTIQHQLGLKCQRTLNYKDTIMHHNGTTMHCCETTNQSRFNTLVQDKKFNNLNVHMQSVKTKFQNNVS